MKKKTPYILIIPIVLLGVFFLLGLLNGIVQSLGYIPAFELREFSLKYYKELLGQASFIDSLKLSLQISLVSSILAAVLGTILAAALVSTGKNKGKSLEVLKLAILIPHTIVALMAISILSQNGLFARMFFKLGFIEGQSDFPMLLYSKNNFAIILSYLWKEIPFVAYFTISLMANISDTLGEAAVNLGASRIKSFFQITLPLTMPAIGKAFLIILSFSFAAYELPFLLGATLPKALPILAHLEYIHPDLRQRPYAMAMNGMILIVSWSMAGILYLIKRRRGRLKGNEKVQ